MLPLINRTEQSYGRSMLTVNDIIEHAVRVSAPVAALTDYHSLSSLPDFLLKCEENGIHGIAGLTVQITEDNAPLGEMVLLAKGGKGFAALRDILDHVGYVGLDHRYNPSRGMNIETLLSGQFKSLFNECVILDGFPGSIGEALLKKESDYSITGAREAFERKDSKLSVLRNQFNEGDYLGVKTPITQSPIASYMAMPPKNANENSSVQMDEKKSILESTLGYAKDDAHARQTMQWFKNYAGEKLNEFGEKKVNQFLMQKYLKSTLSMHKSGDPSPMFQDAKYLKDRCPTPRIFKKQPESLMIKGGDVSPSLKEIIFSAWDKHKKTLPNNLHESYENRLKEELEIIQHCNFEHYFVNIHKIQQLAKADGNDIMLRGSAVASLALHVMQLTPVDPIKYNLLFARFMSKDRVEEPDADLEFLNPVKIKRDMEANFEPGQIAALSNDNGVSKPSLLFEMAKNSLLTFYDLDEKQKERVVLEVDKFNNVLNRNSRKKWASTLSGWEDEIWKNTPEKNKNGISKAIVGIAKSYNKAPLSCSRNSGAIVIIPEGVGRYFNLLPDSIEGGIPQIPQGKFNVIPTGHIKYDLLSNKSFTRAMNIWRDNELDPDMKLDENDPSLAFVFSKGAFLGVNQVSGIVGADLANLIKPKDFNELTAVNALIRDGGDPKNKEVIEQYNFLKNNPHKVTIDEQIKPILAETHGYLLYEEQMMMLLTEIGGFEWSSADKFRSSLKKGKGDVIDSYEAPFIEQASAKYGVSKEVASKWYQPLRDKRGRFVFNKAHAASYAHVGVRQCWLKTHYPANYAAELFCDTGVSYRGNKVELADVMKDWKLLHGNGGPQKGKDFISAVGKVLIRESKNPDSSYSRQLSSVKEKINKGINKGLFDFSLSDGWDRSVMNNYLEKVFDRLEEIGYEPEKHKPLGSKKKSTPKKDSTPGKGNSSSASKPSETKETPIVEVDKPANKRPGMIDWRDGVMIGHLLDFMSKEKLISGLDVATGKASYADHYRFSVKGADGKTSDFHIGAPSTDPVRASLRTKKEHSLSSGFHQGGARDRTGTSTLLVAAELFNALNIPEVPPVKIEIKGKRAFLEKDGFTPFVKALSEFVKKRPSPLFDTKSGGMLSMTRVPIEPTSPVMTELFSRQKEIANKKMVELFEVSRRISVSGMASQIKNGHVVAAEVRSDKPIRGERKKFIEIVANYRKVNSDTPLYEIPLIKNNVLSEGGHQRFMMDHKKGKTSKIDLGFTTRRIRGHVHGHVEKGADTLWLGEAAMDIWSFNEMQREIQVFNTQAGANLPFVEENCVAVRSAGGATDTLEAMLNIKIESLGDGEIDIFPITKKEDITPFSEQDMKSISSWLSAKKIHWLNDNSEKNRKDYDRLISLMKSTGMGDNEISKSLVIHHADPKKNFNQNVNDVFNQHIKGEEHSFLHQSNFETWLRGSDLSVIDNGNGEWASGVTKVDVTRGTPLSKMSPSEAENFKQQMLDKFRYLSGAQGLGLALDNDGAGREDAMNVYKACILLGVPVGSLMPKEKNQVEFTINGKVENIDLKDHNDYLMIIRKLQDAGLYDVAGEVLTDYANEIKKPTVKRENNPPRHHVDVKTPNSARPKFN